MKRIGILALDNCFQSSVTGFYDILSVASIATPLFDLSIVSDRGRTVTCFNGLTIHPHGATTTAGDLDILMLPVIYGDIEPILANKGLIDWIRDQHRRQVCICAVCAGVFVLAHTGLLSGRTATTHWHLAKAFQNQYPDVRLKPEKMLVDEGDIITAGGVTAYMDLALYLTARFGSPELASTLSKSCLLIPCGPPRPHTRPRNSTSPTEIRPFSVSRPGWRRIIQPASPFPIWQTRPVLASAPWPGGLKSHRRHSSGIPPASPSGRSPYLSGNLHRTG